MSAPSANCPNCGALVTFRWSGAVQTTCSFCHSILVRRDLDLAKVGTVADLPVDSSPIQLGTEGVYGNKVFTVVGRILYEYEQGGWNEWHVIQNDGTSAWLSDAQGEFDWSQMVAKPGPLPTPEQIALHRSLMWDDVRFEVTSITQAHYRGVEGELPFEYWDKSDVRFADLRSSDGRFATIDYSEATPLLFMGRSVEFADLRLKKLRAADALPKPSAKTAGLNCPGCGGPLTIRAQEQSLTVVCPQCLSILDAKDPNLQILQTVKASERVQPLIPMGTTGKVRGDDYQVIGFQERTTVTMTETPESWREYLLFNPAKGFRYLTEYDGHWNDVSTVKALPEPIPGAKPPAVKFLGQRFKEFDSSPAATTYVIGEFPWQVRVGETVSVADYIAPPRILSMERTANETTWSLGEYVTGDRIWEMFHLPGKAPVARGLFANQPSNYSDQVKGAWRLCMNFFTVLIGLAVLFYMVAGEKEVFNKRYVFSPRSAGEASFVTDTFEVRGVPSNVEVALDTNLYNNWIYFNFALINEETGQAFDFGREVSYYTGRDSDGSWTEGSVRDSVRIPSVAPGRYYLRVEPETAPKAESVVYDLRLRRSVPSDGLFWVAAFLLLIPPALVSWRALTFEQRRWQQSDFAPASKSSGDDD